MVMLVVIISPASTVKPVYKGHSREPENVSFIYRLKLYSLIGKMMLPFIDNDLLYRGVL